MGLPRPGTAHDYTILYADTDAGPPLKRLHTGATLSQLLDEYVLFSMAPLLMSGWLPVNVIREHLNRIGRTDGVWLLPLNHPVFDLGTDPTQKFWANKLMACEKSLWDDSGKNKEQSLYFAIATAGFINRERRMYGRVLCQDIPTVDVIELHRHECLPYQCPMFDVVTFSIDSNIGVLAFEPAVNPPLDLPKLVRKDPLPETIALAEAFLQNADRPFEVAEAVLKEIKKNEPGSSST